MWWAYELFSCWKFLAIVGNESWLKSKRVYEFIIPGVIALLLYAIYLIWPQVFVSDFLGKLTGNIFQFMVFVVPFHLAALAAFATYSAPILDERLSGTNAQLRVWSNQDNDYFYKDLTLRQYVSLLFGYLCALGIFYILIYLLTASIDFQKVLGQYYCYAYSLVVLVVLFFILQYVVLTIYAITFLFDKVNKVKSV